MNKRAKKQRARYRAQQYGSERLLDALLHGPHPHGLRLTHGKDRSYVHNTPDKRTLSWRWRIPEHQERYR